MTSPTWRRIEELFHAALELDSSEWGDYLDEACGDDSTVRQQVEMLLQGSQRPFDWVNAAIRETFVVASSHEDLAGEPHWEGSRLGPYRVLGVLGHGGLSTVLLAERADETFSMQVAIKVVKRGMDTREILRRLRQERQILAQLDHPHIARLLDGGVTEEGLPFFVMEHIEGEPIDKFCERRDLSIEERLELFGKVCDAVHYAHQSLVVHRDVKPSNILVTKEGVPKLLDFGIAKLLHPLSGEQSLAVTAPGVRLLTPEFASPEQVKGETLTTATDIYSLGVLLYLLLTSRLPLRLRSREPLELERVICQREPERPSIAARGGEESARHRARKLAGDLDNIVLMALRKEPARRYGSVEQLARELERYMEHLPVRARPATLHYRTRKFVERNLLGVSAALSIFILLVVAVAVTTWQAKRARAAQQQAEEHLELALRERQQKEEVSALMVELFEVSDPGEARGNSITAREILDAGAARILNELAGQPLTKAEFLDTMGRVYQNLGLYSAAAPLLETALEIRRESLGPVHLDVAASLNQLGELRFAEGAFDKASPLLQEAFRMRRRLLEEEAPALAESLNNLAVLHYLRGEAAAAERLYRRILEIRRRTLGAEHPDTLRTLSNLAAPLRLQEEYAEAEVLLREVLKVRRRKLGEHPEVASALSNLAGLLHVAGKFEAAEPLHREALALRIRVLGEGHPHVAESLSNLAKLLQDLERDSEAEPLLRRALEIHRERLGENHLTVTFSLNILADLLQARGEAEEAERLYRQVLATRRGILRTEHPLIASSLLRLGDLLVNRSAVEAAEPLLEEAVAIRRQAFPSGHWRIAEGEVALALSWYGQGLRVEAQGQLLRSLPVLEDHLGPEDRRVLQARAALESAIQ